MTKILAGAGDDKVVIGTGAPGIVQGVVGNLVVDGGLGSNRLILQDAADVSPRQVTLVAGLIGAGPGDNLLPTQ